MEHTIASPRADAGLRAPRPTSSGRSGLEICATWVAIVGALCGGAFALFRFIGDLEASRAKEALAYIDRFSEAPVATSYGHFVQYIRQFLSAQDAKNPPTEAAIVAAIRNSAIEADTVVVIHFFDNVQAC